MSPVDHEVLEGNCISPGCDEAGATAFRFRRRVLGEVVTGWGDKYCDDGIWQVLESYGEVAASVWISGVEVNRGPAAADFDAAYNNVYERLAPEVYPDISDDV